MKPEEIDRLFRDELEKLDHVPGIEWSDETAWNKLSAKIKGSWNNPFTWTLSSISFLISLYFIYHMFANQNIPVSEQPKNIAAEADIVKVDSIRKIPKEKSTLVKKNSLLKTSVRTSVLVAPIESKSLDTLPLASMVQHPIDSSLKARQLFNRYHLMNHRFDHPEFSFSMPQLSFLKIKVNNGLNFTNLVKSLEIEKNTGGNYYYFYEYNKNFAPMFYENSHSKFTLHNNYTLTNFNK